MIWKHVQTLVFAVLVVQPCQCTEFQCGLPGEESICRETCLDGEEELLQHSCGDGIDHRCCHSAVEVIHIEVRDYAGCDFTGEEGICRETCLDGEEERNQHSCDADGVKQRCCGPAVDDNDYYFTSETNSTIPSPNTTSIATITSTSTKTTARGTSTTEPISTTENETESPTDELTTITEPVTDETTSKSETTTLTPPPGPQPPDWDDTYFFLNLSFVFDGSYTEENETETLEAAYMALNNSFSLQENRDLGFVQVDEDSLLISNYTDEIPGLPTSEAYVEDDRSLVNYSLLYNAKDVLGADEGSEEQIIRITTFISDIGLVELLNQSIGEYDINEDYVNNYVKVTELPAEESKLLDEANNFCDSRRNVCPDKFYCEQEVLSCNDVICCSPICWIKLDGNNAAKSCCGKWDDEEQQECAAKNGECTVESPYSNYSDYECSCLEGYDKLNVGDENSCYKKSLVIWISVALGVLGALVIGLLITVIVFCCKAPKKEESTLDTKNLGKKYLYDPEALDELPMDYLPADASEENGTPLTQATFQAAADQQVDDVGNLDLQGINNEGYYDNDLGLASDRPGYTSDTPATPSDDLPVTGVSAEVLQSAVYQEFVANLETVDPQKKYFENRPKIHVRASAIQESGKTTPSDSILY